MEYFSQKYRVGAMDLLGVGGSDASAERSGYHIKNILPVVSAAVKALKAKEVHLVAHDWGAIISWVFASRPEYASQIASFTAVSGPHPALARENLFQLPHVPDFIFNKFGRLVWSRALLGRFRASCRLSSL